jgi:hypothetical protein
MYRDERQLHFVCRPYVYARAVSISSQNRKVLLMVLASVAALLWIACLSELTGSVLTSFDIVVQHQTSNQTINRLHKGDRFAPVSFYERWNAIAETNKASHGAQRAERIPDGCEPVFSHVVKVGNFSARCIANVDVLTRLAVVD